MLFFSNDGASAHFDDMVRFGRQTQIVRDKHQGGACFTVETKEHVNNGTTRFCVQIARRFICKQDFRPMNEGAGQGNALLLAA